MKPWLRILGCALFGLFAVAAGRAAPSLSITGVSAAPASARPGDSVTYTVTVTNAGTNTTTDNYLGGTANFTLSLTSTTATTISLGTSSATIPAIGAGASGTLQITSTIPLSTSQASSYFIRASMAGTTFASGAAATATLNVASVAVTSGGTGYTSPPTVSFSSGTAAASASLSSGAVSTVTLTSPGAAYTSVPSVNLTGGAGSGAAATASLGVDTITVTAGGTGYSSAPTVTITGGGGTGAVATATVSGGGVLTGITVTSPGSGYTTVPTVSIYPSGGSGTSSFTTTSTGLAVIGSPDLAVTGLTYPAGTAYKGGDVIPMTLNYTNRSSTNGITNVPYVPSTNGNASFFRIEVILSANPIFGDGDDFLLTFFDVSTNPLNADSANTQLSWNQLLPGNFAGSYYVMAKIDTLSGVSENVENDLSANGNNIYYSPDTNESRITLLPTNFPSVSWASSGGNSYSDNPSISGDGRYTAFASDSTTLGTGDTNGLRDIFLYDRQNATMRKVSLSQQGSQTNGASNNPAISANGTYVAFSSEASNLITSDTNGFSDIYVVNVLTGTLARVSVATAGTQANGGSFKPAISSTGRYVAFESTATNLIAAGTSAGVTHVYLRDRDVSGSGTFDTAGNVSTVLISQSTGGTAGNGNSIQATVSGDGGFVAFATDATNLGGTVTTNIRNIYLRSVTAGTTTLVSTASGGGAAGGSSRAPAINQNTGVSSGTFADGRYIAFGSEASNLVAGDSNGMSDIFVYDRVTAATTRVSLSTANAEATDTSSTTQQLVGSINPSISSTGRYVAFSSLAGNLTGGDLAGRSSTNDANGALDVFVRDRDVNGSGTFDTGGNVATSLASVNRFGYQTLNVPGTATTAASDVYPAISGDGRWVAFPTDSEGTSGLNHGSTNRTSSDSNTFRDIFVYDRRINTLPSAGSPPTVSITSPVSGTSYAVNSTLTLVASASATSGTIASVQFFVNGTSLGTDAAFPYNAPWTPTAVGTFALSALVTDSFGNQTVSNNVNITIAAVSPTAPTVSISSPAAGTSLFASGATTVSATATDPDGTIASVQFFANGVPIGTDTTFPYSVSWTPTATGSYTLTAVATDNGGNQITTTGAGSVTVTVANLTAPSVSISSPTTGSTVQVNAATSITASASSNGSVASVQFLANGTTLATVTSAPFTFAWTPTVAGSYTLTAIATDNLGSQTTSAGSTVTVSAGASPTVSIASPATGTINVNTPQAIVATAADSDGAIASVSFRVNGTTVGIASAFPYQTTWTPTTTGTFTLQAVASDNLGNQTTSAAVSMTVTSGTAPTVSITSPAVSTAIALGSSSTVSANVTANSGLIASVQFFANGIQLAGSDATSPTPPYTASFTPTVPGAYALTAVATDTLGNRTTSSPVNVTVAANQSPSVNVSVASTATFGTATTISATASDSDGTITSVQFFDNGVSLGIDTTSPYSVSWTPNLIGSHNITAVATDNLGAKTTSLVAGVTVVGSTAPTPPTVSITAPGGATTVPINSTQFITATATANAPFATISSVQFFVSDGAVTTPIGSATSFPYSATWGPGSASVLGTRAAGTYTLFAIATDTAGNFASSASVTVSVAAPTAGTPTIAVVAPIDSTTVTVNQPVYLVANATDPDGTVALVEFTVNGIEVGTKAASPYFTAWTPPTAGAYAITATVTDNDGNRVTSSTVNLTAAAATGSVQVAALTFNNPALDATSAAADPNAAVRVSLGSKLIVAAGAVDAGGSIASVQFFANGTSLATDASSPFYTTYTLSTLGSVVLTGLVTDSSGNKIYTFPLFISSQPSVSATNAVVKLVSPANGATYVAGQQIVFEATHNFGSETPPKVDFYLNGFPATTVSAAPYQFIRFLTRAGTYDVQAVIRSGTETTYSSVASITVNSNTAPTVSITSPADLSSATIGTPINLAANATDSDGTIASVQFFANGVAISTDTTFPYAATFTPAAPGTYVLTALATDNSGEQTMSSGVTVSVTSGTAPTVSVTAPAQLAAGSSATISATATAGASSGTIASVQFFANGLSIGSDTTFPYSISFSPAATGTYAITAVATDTLGNQATSTASNVVVAANVAPTAVAITSGSASFALGATSNLTATATDSDGSIASVRFLIDGVTLGTATTSPYTMAWTPTTAGTYAQTVIATDNLGATTTSAAVNVTVTAGNSPTITITSPTAGGALAVNAPATISATASGATSALTIASVQFFANGVSLGTDTVFPYTATFLPTAIGSYTLKAVATDSSGNQSSTSVTVTVQANAAPSGVAVTSPAAGATPGVGVATTITASATDTDGTIASVQFLANGTVVGTATSSPYSVSWTPTINGTYALKVIATDNLGATTTSSTVSVTAGASNAPSGNVTSPLSGATIAIGSTTTVTAIAGANASGATVASVQFLDNNLAIGTDTVFPYTAAWTPLALGTHSLQVLVTDSLGNQFISTAVTVTVAANSAPTVSVTAPAGGATVGVGVATTVTATAADTDGSIASVQFLVANGSNAPVSIGTDSTAPYSISWTPTVAGSYVLTAVATDNLGATTTSANVAVTVAGGNAPTVTISAPTTGSAVAVNAAQTITANAAAVGAGNTIASVQFFANGVSLGSDTTFPYAATWTPTATGTFSLTAIATDTAGNQTVSTTVSVTVQANVSPTVSVTVPATLGVGVAGTLTATAADADGSIASVRFFANGTAIGVPITAAPFTMSFTSNIAGSIQITATATDNLGATTTSSPQTITVSGGNAPTVALTAPATGSTVPVNVAQSVTATATAVGGTISSVEFRVVTGGITTSLGTDTTFPYSAQWTPTAVGSYTLTATATDSNGNQAVASSVITVTATSNAGPSVSIVSPANAATFSAGTPVVLFANGSDSNGSLVSVRFLVNGQVIGNPITSLPYSTTWTPTAAGTYSLTAIAVDNDFNATTSTAVSVTVTAPSGVLPTVTITSPTAGTQLTTVSTVPISAGVSSLAVTSVQFFDNGVSLGTDGTAPFSLNWSPTAPGIHRLVAVATAGTNIVSSDPVDFTVKAAISPNPPTVSLTSPTNGALVAIGTTPPATVSLAATASDSQDGTVARVEFYVNGVLAGTATAFPYSVSFTPTSIGSYTVLALATDNTGNVNTSSPATFTTVASGAPVVSITSPASGVSVPVNVARTIDATVTPNPGRTITSVQFYAGAVLIGTDTTFPYSVTWTPASTGSVVLTAVATDDLAVPGTSPGVNVTVSPGVPPSGAITSPTNASNLTVGVAATLTATATATLPATVQSVDFRVNGVSVGTDTTFPYSVTYTPNSIGTGFQIVAVVTDSQSNVFTTPAVTVNVISAPGPTVAVSAPTAGSSIVIGTPTSVTATATAQATGTTITGVQFFANGTSIGTSTASPFSVTWLPTTGGASSITAVATDSNGTSTTSTAVNVNVTTPPPTVTVTGPAAGAVLPVNVPQTITATATTTTGTIVRVEFLANGVSLGTSDAVFPFSAPWTPVTPGIYALTARATDNFGTVSTSPIVTVTVSGGNAPTVSITSPTTGSSFGVGSTIAITGSATAAIGTIRQVEFFANNVLVGAADTTFPYAATFTPLATGSYSLTAVATDTLGNQTVSAPVTITVADNTPPTVAITGPATGTVVQIGTTPPTVVTITASASDTDGTIANVQFFANGVSIGVDTDFPYSVSFTPTATGTYDLIAVATDNRGGVTTSSTVKLTAVPPGAPTVSITSPVAGAGISNNTLQVVTASASALSGRSISSVTFFANGTQIGTPVTSSPFQVNWTPTVAATYTLTAVATDSVGISTTSAGVAVNVTIAAPPIVSLTSPASGSTISANSTQTLTAAATAQGAATISQVQFFVNGVAQGAADTTVPYVGTWTPTAVGTYSIVARATDSFGTIVDSSPRTVTVTPAPGPTVSITSPSSGSVGFLGIAQSVSATAIASGAANIANVQFFASNGSSVISLGTDTVAPFGVTWTPIAGGSFVITAVATDTNGTQATSPGVTVTVNTGSVPTVSVTSPAGGATLPVNVPRVITADAASSTGNIASVQFFVNGVAVGSDTTFPFSAPWTPLTPGIYALTATATDNLGNVTNSSVVSVTVTGGNAPSVTISNPAGGSTVTAGSTQTVVVNAVAANGTIASVDLLADGVVVSTDTTFPYNFAWTPGGLGVVSLTAVAVDSQGNRAVSTAITVTIAGISAGAPTVAIAAPTAGASLPVGVPALISAIANDADGTIAQVEFFANGASLGVDSVFPYNFSFTPGATGTYVITARATDNGGNIATSSAVSVTVSGGTAPSVAISSPTDATALGVNIPQTITASANSSTGFITSVQFFLNGAPLVTDTTFPYSAPWTPGAIGNYTLTARATDNLGNITDSAVVSVSVGSSAAPTVSLTNPANGTSFTVGTPLTVAADAADSDGSIAQVQFFVNGAPLGSADTVSPYSTVWTANSVGVYALTAQATDNNGNISTSKPITVTIGANAAPTVALTSPVAGSYSLGNLVLVSANANDSDGSIATVQFFANGLAIGTATAAPYSVSWRPSLAGTFSLTAQATDNVGNVTVTTPVSVTITSSAAPVVTITNPVVGTAYGVGNAIPFAATPSGGNGPIAQVQFFVNGTSLGAADTTAPYSATWTPGAPGTYQLLAIATDSAGLSSSTSAVLNIAISGNNAPTVALTSPPSGTSVNGGATVNLTAVAADSDGTIASVRFIANGNVVGTATAIPYSTAWVPSAAGSYTVTAQATDNSGNVTNSAPITVSVVANRSPTVNVTAPGNGATVRVGAGVNLTATANDSDGTIASVQFFANGLAIGSADTTAPYSAIWTPGAEGIYRITATALDNSGAATVSSQITVLAIIPGANGSDIAYSGGYQGAGESGRFAAVNVRGTNATFIAFSSAAPSRIYFFSGLPVDTNGGFASFDTVGRSLISGTASDTGATGTLDAGRVTFIGSVSFGAGSGIASGYYTGSITGRPESTFAAIVGPDGTITIFASDGTFRDAGSATVAANGNFTVTTLSGTRFAGRADPATGFITGGITGGPGGGFTAAISSGVSFSDGFLKNLSTRGQVGSGSNILIAGFIVAGDTPKQVLIRAIGPSLTAFGVTGALADPQLQLFNGNSLVATNDNWGGASDISTAANLVGAFPLSPTSLDSVIYATLPPGSYTAQVSGVGGRTGVALVELYDTDTLQPFSAQKVTNVATRGVVGSGQSQLIAGFVVSGNTSKKVLIRAVGPTLGAAPFNVAGVLADPILRLQRSDELVIRENDNWETGNDAALITEASAKVGAFPLARGAKDAAILINLPPGSYSAQVTGPGTTTGVALVEVYEVP